ncbi:MAG TPA: BON domain-containing protein [Gemmatimonadales bacterium]|nr:BON domain-containing protein [Gemmatimonadales bacterium]
MNVQQEALQRELLAALDWEPRLAGSMIDVKVAHDGVITLTGVVKSYADKVAAERTVKHVKGVRAVVNDIDVRLLEQHERTDTELAEAVVQALEWDVLVPHDKLWARVSDGWVRLEGTVNWNFQRTAAEEAVHRLTGVKRVSNLIAVRPQGDEDRAARETVKDGIEAALKRSAELEANNIEVEAHQGNVVLRGRVNSWAEREAAEAAAWAARGVATVDDRLQVGS